MFIYYLICFLSEYVCQKRSNSFRFVSLVICFVQTSVRLFCNTNWKPMHSVELFSTRATFQKPMFGLYFIFLFALIRVDHVIYCCVFVARSVCCATNNRRPGEMKSERARGEKKEDKIRFHQNKSHGWKHSHTEWQPDIIENLWELLSVRADFKYSSAIFSLNYWKEPLGNKSWNHFHVLFRCVLLLLFFPVCTFHIFSFSLVFASFRIANYISFDDQFFRNSTKFPCKCCTYYKIFLLWNGKHQRNSYILFPCRERKQKVAKKTYRFGVEHPRYTLLAPLLHSQIFCNQKVMSMVDQRFVITQRKYYVR